MKNHSNIKYSIVIPHLSNSKCIDLCLEHIKKNSVYPHEIIEIVDERDVYYAFNKGVYQSSCNTVVLLNDDMIVAKDWDKYIPVYSSQSTILTGYLVEPNPGNNGPKAPIRLHQDCGTPSSFDFDMFQSYVDTRLVPEVVYNKRGWYMPLVVDKRSFLTYPNIRKFPQQANDVMLIDELMPKAGFKFAQINMFAYHFQRQTTQDVQTKKRAIFTYSNHQIDEKIQHLQSNVVEKFNDIYNCVYEYLRYNGQDGDVMPDHVIDYGFEELFTTQEYDTILMLDVDCVPLSTHALEYMFQQAEQGKLVGNIQRSNHIANGQHVYVAPSAMCISKDTYRKLGRPSFAPTQRSDVGEELTFIANSVGVPVEMFMPASYEALPHQSEHPWDLADGMPKYGIGTTFVNSAGEEMFYHLFQTRVHVFNELFYKKCTNILLT